MSKRLMAMLVGVMALAAIVAGCGGSSDDEETQTKVQFIKQADKICERISDKRNAEYQAFARKAQSAEALENGAADIGQEVLLPNFEAKVEELNELASPSQGEEEIEAWFDALDEALAEAQEDPNILIGFADDPNAPLIRANRIAREYGFEECDFA